VVVVDVVEVGAVVVVVVAAFAVGLGGAEAAPTRPTEARATAPMAAPRRRARDIACSFREWVTVI
jgi:hypothetical protein